MAGGSDTPAPVFTSRLRRTGDVIDALGFGKHNIVFLVLIAFSTFLACLSRGSEKFAVHDAQYRCYIPECMDERYNQEWLWHAVPFHRHTPSRCERYAPRLLSEESLRRLNYTCPRDIFDQSRRTRCSRWVFGERNSVVQEFDIPCRPDKIELFHLSGAVGRCICFLLIGWLSDKYGRRRILLASCLAASATGFAASLTRVYELYLTLHFLNSALGSGAFSIACVLVFESTPSDRRLLGFALIHAARATAAVCLGAIALTISHWRLLYQVTHFPNLFNAVLLLFVEESAAWILLRRSIFTAMRETNEATYEFSVYSIYSTYGTSLNLSNVSFGSSRSVEDYTVKRLWGRQGRPLVIRWAACSVCLTVATLASSRLGAEIFHDERYEMHTHFIATNCLELIGAAACWAAMERLGARNTSGASLVACLAASISLSLADDNKVLFIFAARSILHVSVASLAMSISMYELQISPTTHRHAIFSWSWFVASVVTVCGSFAPDSRRCCYAVLSALCVCCITLFYSLPDITGRRLFDTVAQSRRVTTKKKKINPQISVISYKAESVW